MKHSMPKPGQRIWVKRKDKAKWQKLIVTEIAVVRDSITMKRQNYLIHFQGRISYSDTKIVYCQGCCMAKDIYKIRDSKLDPYELFRGKRR